ncbi:MAG: nucleotidyltransferase family protein [Fulvivirga sp.]|uniref:nucleotidyltransferase family protein n=1 Tax=Fulvivirga sp. TaxID=1931237 RepID=UPI0032EF8C88
MRNFKDHLILKGSSIKSALEQLNNLASDAILFVVDEHNKLIGSVTDGDIRRGLLKEIGIEQQVETLCQGNPRFVTKGDVYLDQIVNYRSQSITIIPILTKDHIVTNVINLRHLRSYLPVDVVIMAGGRGSRLRPLTDTVPKPLLKVGGKPIIEHNIERLALYGIDDFWLSINYLGYQLREYFSTGRERNVHIEYIEESEPLGTIGSIALIEEFHHDFIMVTNSDILTNLDYEHFFLEFISNDSDLSVVTIPYKVNIPYAVIETADGRTISDFKEKPTYTYYSNGGIYLMKRSVIDIIPHSKFYNATDLMEEMIKKGMKVTSYPFEGYWLDIGKHEDFKKAQEDIIKIRF